MACFLALIVFSIMGIFSATHRALALEAFQCVFRKITLRPCNTDFKEKIKGQLVGKVLGKSIFLAKLLNKHFELFSWAFSILMIISTVWVIRGGVNFYLYGSCSGLNQASFCAFDPTGENNKISTVNNGACPAVQPNEKNLTLQKVNLDTFPRKNRGARNKVVFIGCYSCDYSRKAYLEFQELMAGNSADFTFVHYPVKNVTKPLSALAYCAYQRNQNTFWSLNEALFKAPKERLSDPAFIDGLVSGFGFNLDKMHQCTASKETWDIVDRQMAEIQKTNFYGTPTIFINGSALVGPKPSRVYERLLSD
ncbi:thioredoxin domain-containing protein [Candidatus Peregrinibacteria bacterium]|nr:thioredoxin domain-containing protein [Candidatus Peregrinibacteria bacterium]